MQCPKCGYLVTEENGFCPGCGTSLLKITLEPSRVSGNSAFSMAGDLDLGGTPPVAPPANEIPEIRKTDPSDFPPVQNPEEFSGEETISAFPPVQNPKDFSGEETISVSFTPSGHSGAGAQPTAGSGYIPRHVSPSDQVYTGSVWDQINSTPKEKAPDTMAASEPGANRFCTYCGARMTAGSAFCVQCGKRVREDGVSAPPCEPEFAPVPPVKPVSYRPDTSAGAPPTRAHRAYASGKKKSKLLAPILAGVALLVVVALVIALLSILGGPLVKIGAAGQKTMKSGNFTVEFSVDGDGMSGSEGIMYADIDVKERQINLYGETDDISFGIYDGYIFVTYEDEGYKEDIEDELDELFDAYEASDSEDIGTLLEELDDMMNGELSDLLDLDEMETCAATFIKDANTEKWLKDNAGYSKSRENGETLYSFDLDFFQLLQGAMPYFESAFEDEDDYDTLMDEIDEIVDEEDPYDVVCTIGVKSGYLSSFELEIDDGWDEMTVSMKISDVNKTKLDLDELEQMLDDIR